MLSTSNIHCHYRKVWSIIDAFFFPMLLFAQMDVLHPFIESGKDSNKTNIRFERNVYTYIWNVGSNYKYNDSINTLNLSDNFTSSVIRRNFFSIRDENSFLFIASHKLSENFSLRILQ